MWKHTSELFARKWLQGYDQGGVISNKEAQQRNFRVFQRVDCIGKKESYGIIRGLRECKKDFMSFSGVPGELQAWCRRVSDCIKGVLRRF